MTDLVEFAKAYLVDEPSYWSFVAKALSDKVASWVTMEEIQFEGVSTESDFSEKILSELLSPSVITVVAGSDNLRLSQEFIALTINDCIKCLPIHVDPTSIAWDYSTYYKYDEDYTVLGIGAKRSEFIESDDSDTEPTDFTTNAMDGLFDLSELNRITLEFLAAENIQKIIDKSNASLEGQGNLIYRLDVIDISLYKALIEHPDLLHSVDWRTFEKLLADIVESFGYEVELQRGTKDGGVDLFAIKRTDPFGPHKYLLQAKKWSNKVEVDPVRQLAFLHDHYRVTKSCLATTSTFTRGAWELAKQYQWNLELRDFDGLQEWIHQAAKSKFTF